jgi:hemoglobin-like flavoprotein
LEELASTTTFPVCHVEVKTGAQPAKVQLHDWERERALMDMNESLQRILASQQVLGDSFYEALFARHPEFGPYFAGADPRRQAVALTMQLTVIDCYHRLCSPAARLYLQYLGTKHHGRAIPQELYGPFRDTLLEVMQRLLGQDWTEELATEWKTAIDNASAVMFEGYAKRFSV